VVGWIAVSPTGGGRATITGIGKYPSLANQLWQLIC
jgi:hypothetical protein